MGGSRGRLRSPSALSPLCPQTNLFLGPAPLPSHLPSVQRQTRIPCGSRARLADHQAAISCCTSVEPVIRHGRSRFRVSGCPPSRNWLVPASITGLAQLRAASSFCPTRVTRSLPPNPTSLPFRCIRFAPSGPAPSSPSQPCCAHCCGAQLTVKNLLRPKWALYNACSRRPICQSENLSPYAC
jgi:hypothetical protein